MIRGFNNINQNDGSNGNSSFGEKIKQYWSEIPLMVKIICSITITFYLLSWFKIFNPILNALVNIPYFTVTKFKIWTLATTILITPSIINILFAGMAWLPSAIVFEKELGSTRYILNLFTRSIIIQILYVVLTGILAILFGSEIMIKPSVGLWPIILGDITIQCQQNPEREMMLFLVPYPIKARYYPWALVGFFALLNFSIQFDLFAGIIFGYLYVYYIKDKIDFSDLFLNKVEQSIICKCFISHPSFIQLQNMSNSTGFHVTRPQPQQDPQPNISDYEVIFLYSQNHHQNQLLRFQEKEKL